MRTHHANKRFHPRRNLRNVVMHEPAEGMHEIENSIEGGSLKTLAHDLSRITLKSHKKKMSRRQYIF